MTSSNKLKRSWVVTLISIGMLTAPIGNFLFSSWTIGLFDQGSAELWGKAFGLLTVGDWLTNVSLVVAGALLWRQHKISWILACAIVMLVTIVNLHLAWTISQGNFSDALRFQLGVNMIATFVCLGLLLFMRYPYIDRRHGWIANDPRYDVESSCQVQLGQDTFPAKLVSISRSGARIEYDPAKVRTEHQPEARGILRVDESSIPECNFEVVMQTPGVIRLRWEKRLSDITKLVG